MEHGWLSLSWKGSCKRSNRRREVVISNATAVHETRDLEGDDALETLRSTGWGELTKQSFARFRTADGFSHARALGFQLALTAVPGLIALVGLATSLDQARLRQILQSTLTGFAPGPSQALLTQAFRQGSETGEGGSGALALGFLAALFSGAVAMAQVERGANRIYGDEHDRPTASKYLNGLLMACSAGVLIVAAFLLVIAGPAVADAGRQAGWSETLTTLWSLARWPLGVIAIIGAFSVLFKEAPRRAQPDASWLSVGAAVSVVLWLLFTGVLAAYLSLSRGLGSTYGPLAGQIGMLLWAYASSVALFIGIAFAAQLEDVRSRSRQH
jgi:YihY family inner membrane protein